MRIERLLFQVNPPEMVKDFILADAEVWNPWLQRQPGFMNKTQRVVSKGMVEILVFWKSGEDLEKASKKKNELATVENILRSRSPARYTLVSSS